MTNWDNLISELESARELEVGDELFLLWSRVLDEVNETYIRAYTAKQLDTSDEAAQAHFKDILSTLVPRVTNLDRELRKRVLKSNFNNPRYARILETFRRKAAISESEDTEAQKEIRLLEHDLSQRLAKQRVKIGDETLGLAQAAARRASTKDRREREAIWRETKAVQLANDTAVREQFFDLVQRRHALATAAGYNNYRDYVWDEKGRADYTPENVFDWLEAYEEIFEPSYEELRRRRTETLSTEDYRPWDFGVYPQDDNLDLSQVDYLAAGKLVFAELSPEFVRVVEDMETHKLIDLESRADKASGNFAGILKATQKALVVCNCHGRVRDIGALFHEGGHAIHMYTCVQNELHWGKSCSYEILETVAHIFTLLGLFHTEALELFEKDLLVQERVQHAELILAQLLQKVSLEHFQHRVYTQIEVLKAPEDFDTFYTPSSILKLSNWHGLEREQAQAWQTNHVLTRPFYDIEYFIAWIAALAFLESYRRTPEAAVERLKLAMSYGETRSITETLGTLGVEFPFQKRSIERAKQIFDRELLG